MKLSFFFFWKETKMDKASAEKRREELNYELKDRQLILNTYVKSTKNIICQQTEQLVRHG